MGASDCWGKDKPMRCGLGASKGNQEMVEISSTSKSPPNKIWFYGCFLLWWWLWLWLWTSCTSWTFHDFRLCHTWMKEPQSHNRLKNLRINVWLFPLIQWHSSSIPFELKKPLSLWNLARLWSWRRRLCLDPRRPLASRFGIFGHGSTSRKLKSIPKFVDTLSRLYHESYIARFQKNTRFNWFNGQSLTSAIKHAYFRWHRLN